jgi:hypothetical protein
MIEKQVKVKLFVSNPRSDDKSMSCNDKMMPISMQIKIKGLGPGSWKRYAPGLLKPEKRS